MLDSLDLHELQERGQKYQKQARSKRRPALIMAVLVLLVTAYVQFQYTPPGGFYWQDGQSWNTPQGDSALWQLEYSDDGTLWALDWETSNLHRYSDNRWTEIEPRTLGTNERNVRKFTVTGNEVWAVVEGDVAHFDGQHWRAYNEVLSLDAAAGIAAGEYGVVIADHERNLVMFDGTNWHYNHFIDVLPDYYYHEDNYTSLIGDADGVWLSSGGLWHYNGQAWKLVMFYPAGEASSTYLIGVDEYFVYLASYGRLLTVKKSSYQTAYSDFEAGFPEDADYLLHAENHNGVLWVAVDRELYTFDGQAWSLAQVNVPNMASAQVIWDFAFAPDDSLVVGTLNPDAFDRGFLEALQPIFLMCGTPFLLIVIIMYLAASQSILATERAALVRKRLPTLLPDMPEYVPLHNPKATQKPWRSVLFTIVLMIAIGTFPAILGASPLQAMFIVAALFVLVAAFPMIRRLFNRDSDTASRAYLFRNILITALVMGTSIIGMWLALDFMSHWMNYLQLPIAVQTLITFAGAFLVFIVLVWAWGVLPAYYIVQPLKQGDYDAALKRAENLRKLMPKYLNFMMQHCFVLVVRGDYETAKALYQEILTEAQNHGPALVAPMLCNYAIALRETGQTDEALQMLEAAAKILPDSVSGYRSLAEFYFVLGQFPARALEVTDVMMQFAKKPRINLLFSRYSWGYTLGVRAVTLANVGRFEEADAMMAQALTETDRKYRPGLALLHLYEAYIARAKDDIAALQQAVQKALDADAQSAAAKIAQRLLAVNNQGMI